MEEKIWVKSLLDDVRRDAIGKSQGATVTEQVYSAIIEIIKLTREARKEGLLALEEAMKNELENGQLEPGLNHITILPMGIEYIVNGIDEDDLVEILTTKYWVTNPQEMEALTYYICIRGMNMIQKNLPIYYLEALLTALLPEKCIAEYERRKEERIPEMPKPYMEVLLEKELDLPRRSIIIRDALEEKINQASESVVKTIIQKLDDNLSAVVLRGLGKTCKKKLLSCMSPTRRNAVMEAEEYFGPVRTIDMEDIMVKVLEYFEETEDENATS